MRAGSSDIEAVSVVRDLGVMIDSQLSMHEHVSRTARACFFLLRRLRSILQQLGRDVTAKLVVALVFLDSTTVTSCWPVSQSQQLH